jgi:acetyltransferase-like isoleucine patch superfamily enzyme
VALYLCRGAEVKKAGAHVKVFGAHRIEFGKGVALGDFCWIQAVVSYGGIKYDPILSIGDHVAIGDLTHISCLRRISIGAGSLLGSKIYIGDHGHGSMREYHQWVDIPPAKRRLGDVSEIIIGKNVWIGDGAVILAGAHIADSSVIGANSVVSLSVNRAALIAGVPARVIRYLDESPVGKNQSGPVGQPPS